MSKALMMHCSVSRRPGQSSLSLGANIVRSLSCIAPRAILWLGCIFLLTEIAEATSNYRYGPKEYVAIQSGASPDEKYFIAAHGEDDLGYTNFRLYLMEAGSRRAIAPLQPIKTFVDTRADAYHADWSDDSSGFSITYREERHLLARVDYRITAGRPTLVGRPTHVQDLPAHAKVSSNASPAKEAEATTSNLNTSDDSEQFASVVSHFCDALIEHNYPAAFEFLSSRTRGLGLEPFQTFVAQDSAFSRIASITINETRFHRGIGIVNASIALADGASKPRISNSHARAMFRKSITLGATGSILPR